MVNQAVNQMQGLPGPIPRMRGAAPIPELMRKNLFRLAAGALALLCQAACAAPINRMILPDDVVPAAYRIEITPHMAESTFDGRVEIDVDVRRRTNRIELDSADLAIAGATLDGDPVAPRMALDAKRQRA